MKRFMTIMSTMAVLLVCSIAVVAQTKGYALYGDVPTDYTDLTSNVQVVAPAVISGGQNMASTDHVAPSADGVAFTGRGHSNHYCQGSADLSIRFSENQTLTLTENYAIHVKIKRTNAGSGDIQMSFIRNSWGSVRVGFLMDASKLSDTESEIVLKYADRKQNGGGQYYCNGENQTYGTRTFNGGNGTEIFRMTAANGEAFLITGLYLEATYEEPTPGPGPEPEPVAEKRYYFVRGGDLPTIDGVSMVDLRAPDNAAWSVNQFSNLTNDENGVQFTLPGGWGVAELKPKAQALADVIKADWHLKIKFETDATHLNGKNLRINIGSNGGNGNFYLSQASYDGIQEMTFALADAANTMTFPVPANNQMFQLHANGGLGGTYFKVIYAYLTNDPSSDEEPAGDPSDETAPAGLTASASEVSQNSLKLTMTAIDDSEGQITYVVTYDTDKTKSVKAASGADAEVVVDGLTADTDYSFSIVAKDATGNTTDPVVVNQRTAKEPLGYALYGVVPEDYVDLTGKINLPAGFDGTLVGAGYSNPNICQNSAKEFTVKEGFTMSLTDEFALHVVIKKHEGSNGAVGVSLINGDWNSKRIGWEIANTKLNTTTYTDVVLKYSARDTRNWNCDGVASFTADEVTYSGQILRIAAANGEQFDIQSIYLEKKYVKPVVEIPHQDPQRIYLKKGSAETPADVTEDVHTSYVVSQYYNCIPSEDFYGVTTAVREWWMNFQIQSNEAVDLSPVYGTWRLVVAFSSAVADMDREYTFTLGAISGTAGAPTVKKIYSAAKSGQRVVWQLPLSEALSVEDAEHLSDKAAGEYLLDMATGFNNKEGQRIEFDYIYFTNEPEGDHEAPVFTKNEAEPQVTTITLTLNATDEAEAITYTINYENAGAQQEVATGVQGADKEVVITGLQPETAYTFSITATDEHGNTSEPVVVNATTLARGTNRYYLYRGDNTSALPVVDGVNMVDVRPTAHATVTISEKATRDNAQTEYVKVNVKDWFAIDHTPSATVENDIDDTYYLVVRFKARLTSNFVTGNNLRFNLKSGAAGFYINSTAEVKHNNGVWHTVVLPLASVDAAKKPALYLQSGQIALQIHENANPNALGYIAIDYAYFTNDISVLDPGTQGNVFTLDGSDAAADNSDLLAADGEKVDVQLQRSLVADGGLYTLCLPFSLDADETQNYFPGAFSQLVSSELRGDMIHLNFEPVAAIEAGVPYLYCPTSDVVDPLITDVRIDATSSTTVSTTYFDMEGVYSPAAMPEGTYFLGANDYLYQINPADAGKLKATRAYFVVREGAPAGVRARVVMTPHTTTDMPSAEADATVTKVLRNGQICIQRDGCLYNMMGQLLSTKK